MIAPRRLAGNAAQYNSRGLQRPKGDALGIGGLPAERDKLDYLVDDLCRRLTSFGRDGIGGRWLANTLRLRNTRSLRHLVAYARVHCHRHEIVGIPGSGYIWGECDPSAYKAAIRDNMKRGRCHFFIASLHKRQGTAMSMVQMAFDFFEHQAPHAVRHDDELAAMIAAEGATIGHFLDALVQKMAESDEGRQALAEIGQKHAAVLIPKEIFDRIADRLDGLRGDLLAAATPAPTTPPPAEPTRQAG